MSLLPILPTGAMASGEYTDYMIGYLGNAMEDFADQLEDYLASVKAEDWYNKWSRTSTDINSKVTALNTDVTKLKNQCKVAQDIINKH